jgi:hypothetical protein
MELVVGLTGVCDTRTYVTGLGAIGDRGGGCLTPGTENVTPNDISQSDVYQRMSVRDGDEMPPVGTEDPDTDGLSTIERWIMGNVPQVDPP